MMMLEAISRSHLTTRARYLNGQPLSQRLRWQHQENVALAVLCHTNANVERAAEGLGRTPKGLVHRALETGLKMPREWRDLIYKRHPAEPRLLLQYPYVKEVRGEHEILMAVNALVPRGLPGELRADVCQEMLADIYMGDITLEELRADGKLRGKYVSRMKRDNYESSGWAVSLDQPMRDGRSWYDVLPEPEADEADELMFRSFDEMAAALHSNRGIGGVSDQQTERHREALRRINSYEESVGLVLDEDDLEEYRDPLWRNKQNAEPLYDRVTASAVNSRPAKPKIIAARPPRKHARVR